MVHGNPDIDAESHFTRQHLHQPVLPGQLVGTYANTEPRPERCKLGQMAVGADNAARQAAGKALLP